MAASPDPSDDQAVRNLVRQFMNRIRGIYGDKAVNGALPEGSDLRDYRLQSWSYEPWVRGGFSVPSPGAVEHRRNLADPESGRLFFAGEAVGGKVNGDLRGDTVQRRYSAARPAADRVEEASKS